MATIRSLLILCAVLMTAIAFVSPAIAQSSNQNFPTPIRSNELSGTIRARDIGDSRLTTHFYSFVGNQGDIFINVVTKNFDGDIDVFTADTLKPLTKIVVYSDGSEIETGRVIYVRQAQKLLLRIEGRSPNDDPALYRFKFAGSFAPSNEIADAENSKDPEVSGKNDGDVKVNSVGTIIAVKPKPTPSPKPAETAPSKSTTAVTVGPTDRPAKSEKPSNETVAKNDKPKPEVVVTDDLPKSPETKSEEPAKPDQPKSDTPKKPKTPVKPSPKPEKPRTTKTTPTPSPEAKTETPAPNPLENIRLVVVFKDGRKIERPMSEVVKFSVDKGILTIINKDGSIGRFSILDILKITIE